MQAVYGAFFVEDRSCQGQPWTDEDERRLQGRFVLRGGRLAPPHVLCRGGAFFIGTVPLEDFAPLAGRPCYACKAPKVDRRHTDGRDFCFGCGALQ